MGILKYGNMIYRIAVKNLLIFFLLTINTKLIAGGSVTEINLPKSSIPLGAILCTDARQTSPTSIIISHEEEVQPHDSKSDLQEIIGERFNEIALAQMEKGIIQPIKCVDMHTDTLIKLFNSDYQLLKLTKSKSTENFAFHIHIGSNDGYILIPFLTYIIFSTPLALLGAPALATYGFPFFPAYLATYDPIYAQNVYVSTLFKFYKFFYTTINSLYVKTDAVAH
ncbi:hypothetical protein ACH42_03945 [Endozoicomonas sp. (ex Bugula neritina AB1)]|nr:hypothetical protein ACH42_03945 [Endozoicomonas sp. (ex Bugula neritina AB1)]